MNLSIHRSKAGFAWRSCKARVGRLHFMATVARDWCGLSAVTPLGFLFVQRHPNRTIVHGGWTR